MTPESHAQVAVRLAASRAGARLWRNNCGAGVLQNGSFVRGGRANESEAVNRNIKSADLIGIRPVLITPGHVGQTLGVFVSREVKPAGWRFHPNDPHEAAQERWAALIRSFGGDACFTTGEWV